MKELKSTINEFDKILKRYPDKKQYAFEYFSFFKNLQRVSTNSKVLPILELATVLKHKKPIIFYELRNYSSRSHMIDIITNIEMDLITLNKRLSQLKLIYSSSSRGLIPRLF